MSEVSVNIRCSNGEKFATQVNLNGTILAFKQKISEQAGVPFELQRLIYKGRVMKEDQNTLASYSVEADSTVHLVRSHVRPPAPAPSAAAPSAATAAGTAAAAAAAGSPFGAPPGAGGAANPFADMMGGMGAGGGGMDISRMQQQLMSNPEMMASIMNSPMMESLLNNPDMLRNIMFSNPQMQEVMQNNPQLAQVLNDPATMRQYLDMARNPEAMNQARRSQDLMMSQIENQPGGFNALRRLYTEVQEPMMQASEGMANNDNAGANTNATAPAVNPSAGPNTSALPNPWAPAGPPAANPGTAAGNAPAIPAPGANPWAGLAGAMPGMGGGGMPGMGGGGVPGAPGMPGVPGVPGMGANGQFDPAMMQQIMLDPMVQQMVAQMADDPALMDTMVGQNWQMQQALQENPALRDQLPQFMRSLADPQNVQAIAQMHQSMHQLQRAGIIPPGGGIPGMGDIGGMGGLGGFGNLNLSGGGVSPLAAGGLDFSSLLGGGAPPNPWAGTPPPPPSSTSSNMSSSQSSSIPPSTPTPAATTPLAAVANPEVTYAAQLAQMNDMGFTDRAACVRALVASQGNVNAAVERMLGGGV